MGNLIENIGTYLTKYGLSIIAAILIFVIGRIIAKLLTKALRKLMIKAKIEETLVNFAEHFCYVLLMIFIILAALRNLGVETTSFIAVIGAAGLAVGLALQGSLSNFAAGVLMMVFKPFKVGDFVQIAGTMGTVKEIQIFNTILTSPDNIKVIIPNAKATGDNILNFTVNGTRRIDMVIGVSYEDDLKKTKSVIESILAEDPRILKDPAPTVAVADLADSSVNFVVRPWAAASDYWDVKFDMTQKIKEALDANSISIPFPQHDVHLFNADKA